MTESIKLRYTGDDNPGPRGGKVYLFFCPGCGNTHPFEIECAERGWTWNGSMTEPTFTPSLMCNAGHESQCHLFMTGGKIQFLSDCHHKLAGQTVDVPDWEEGMW